MFTCCKSTEKKWNVVRKSETFFRSGYRREKVCKEKWSDFNTSGINILEKTDLLARVV